MTIQRQYSLPNCILSLEGLTDATNIVSQSETRPVLSILVNAECHLAGIKPPLSGGREFVESLINTVSNYAQEFLSGIHSPRNRSGHSNWIELSKLGPDVHRLTIYPQLPHHAPDGGQRDFHKSTNHQTAPIHLDLTTVQLFDLVEAVDQLLADTQTLPDLSLHLTPLSKRDVISAKPLVQRAAPVALGLSSLAVAAIAFSLVPIPQVQRPPESTPQSNPDQSQDSATNPKDPTAKSPSPTPNSQTPDVEVALNTAPEITDPKQLNVLKHKLSEQIFQKLPKNTTFEESLIYRVGVDQKGAIVGYKAVNSAAVENAKKTPLPELLYIPVPGSNANAEPIAQFKVLFDSKGELDVTPWKQPITDPSSRSEITDRDELDDLNQKLYDQINKRWQGSPTFDLNLVYRVTFTENEAILDYEPINQPAFDYVRETPLPDLHQPAAPDQAASSEEPLAYFRVVFTPRGILQVSPW